jgi:hypothetical protein
MGNSSDDALGYPELCDCLDVAFIKVFLVFI